MSIEAVKRDQGYDDTFFMPDDWLCFFCGEELGDVTIFWSGSGENGSLALHPSCALALAVELMRDVWEYKSSAWGEVMITARKPYQGSKRRQANNKS